MLGFDEFKAGVLPGRKRDEVIALRKRFGPVVMAGEGVNDDHALAAADAGLTMRTSGMDLTMETADIVLMSDDLAKIPYTMGLSGKVMIIIPGNILTALTTKLVFLLLGIPGVATLWLAVLADDGASLAVILNGVHALWHSGRRR